MEWLDIHLGNIGVALPMLNNHSVKDVLWYFNPESITIVFLVEQPSDPQTLPVYLVPPISILKYLLKRDPTFDEASLQGVIMDLRNGQDFQLHSHGV